MQLGEAPWPQDVCDPELGRPRLGDNCLLKPPALGSEPDHASPSIRRIGFAHQVPASLQVSEQVVDRLFGDPPLVRKLALGAPGEWDTGIMGARQPSAAVRVGRPDEFADLRRIEFEADRLFESVGIGPFTNDESENHLEQAALVLVAGDPPVGFICIELVDEHPHIWQLAVHPEHGRQGHGRALVAAACDWARSGRFDAITLTTFRDVPWNGPFYESLGFVPMDTLAPELSTIREHERSVGDDDFGARMAMRLPL